MGQGCCCTLLCAAYGLRALALICATQTQGTTPTAPKWVQVPPVFMFQAKIFQPPRLCAIYKRKDQPAA